MSTFIMSPIKSTLQMIVKHYCVTHRGKRIELLWEDIRNIKKRIKHSPRLARTQSTHAGGPSSSQTCVPACACVHS